MKHFKWRSKVTRRIHDTPNWTEIRACDVWLRLELSTVQPELLVLLGATAAKAVLGGKARVTQLRGSVLERPEVEVPVVLTLHPSAVLRAGDGRAERRTELVEDLTLVRKQLGERARASAARR